MGEALITLDPTGRVTYLNAAAERLLGWPLDELSGQVLHEAAHFRHPDGSDYPIEACPLNRALQQAEALRVEDDVFVRKDGSDVSVAYAMVPFALGDRPGGSIVVMTDNTARKADEARLRQEIETLSQMRVVREALDDDRMVLYAQPIVDLATGETVQHELLIGMLDREANLIPPGDFLPAAELNGQIREIDRWVILEAARMIGGGQPVEINLSADSLVDPDSSTSCARGSAPRGPIPPSWWSS